MSDILIRGMNAPTDCGSCPCYGWDYGICRWHNKRINDYCKKDKSCPIHELPEHGDLKDARLIRAELAEMFNVHSAEIDRTAYEAAVIDILAVVSALPTVIPAERIEDS